MRNRLRIAACAVLMLGLMVPAFGVVSEPQADGDGGAGETRSVPDHGYGGDDFSEPGNTTAFGSASVSGGNLTLTDLYNRANFDDGTLDGWEVQKTNIELINGQVRCRTGTIHLDVTFDDFTLNCSVMMAKINIPGGQQGWEIHFWGTHDPIQFTAYYENYDQLLHFIGRTSTGQTITETSEYYPSPHQWYNISVEHLGDLFNLSIDGITYIRMRVPNFTDILQIWIGTGLQGDVYYDNITIRAPDAQGHAITPTVTLPFNRWWDWVEISKSQNLYGRAKFSVLMPYANHVISRYENLTTNSVIIDDIFMDDTDKLYLEFWMTGEDYYYPRIDWWKIYWRPDPPTQSRDIPDIHLMEDAPQQDVINLTDYFADWYVPRLNFTFEAVHSSNWSHVRPIIHGRYLSVELPARDWHGTETVRVNCSDGEFNVTSRNITVVVEPVNDPPVISPLGAFDVFEETLTEFNLTPFLGDAETDVEDLSVRTDSANCTVLGQNLTFFYDVGDVTEQVAIYVSDGELEVGAVLDIHVINVNDPPVIATIPRQTATEESPFVIDVGPFLSDEDDLAGALIITCDHPNVVGIEGQAITILFPEYVEPQTVGFHVSDGKATVLGWFVLEVVPINDPPVLRSIGGRPVSGTFSIEMNEGEVLVLPLDVVDVDSPSPRVYVDSNLAGFELLANGSLRIAPARGVIGDFWASITVDDLDGGIVEVNVTIAVANVNDSPAVPRILSPVNGTVFDEGASITFNAEFSDPDTVFGQVLTVVWRSNVSGVLKEFTSENATSYTRNDLASGMHLITVTVSDGDQERSANLIIKVIAKETPPIDGEDGEDGGEGFPVLMIGLVIAVIIILVVIGLYLRSRK